MLALRGIGTDIILVVDNTSNEATRRAFEALAHVPSAPHRIVLLVNMGTEGWNCPSLFACALVRKLANSNNFVLQAATRCLRQVPGNTHPARVYLTSSNQKAWKYRLAETYGTGLKDLGNQHAGRVEKEIVLHKPNLPPLLIKKRVLRYRRKTDDAVLAPLVFTVPNTAAPQGATVQTLGVVESESGITKLQRLDAGDEQLPMVPPELDAYTAAAELAANYHLGTRAILAALRAAYGADKEIPDYHLDYLGQQIEEQQAEYDERFEEIDIAVALVKSEGFDRSEKDGQTIYTARISFAKEREELYKMAADTSDSAFALATSFHYEGYNFDSNPEKEFLDWALETLKVNTHQIEGLWFTGGLTDPTKTDSYAEYLGEDGRWHHYTPDFLFRRVDGKHLVVEIKRDTFSPDIQADFERHASGQEPQTPEGRKAVALKRWEELNPDRLTYHVMFNELLHDEGKKRVREFMLGE